MVNNFKNLYNVVLYKYKLNSNYNVNNSINDQEDTFYFVHNK